MSTRPKILNVYASILGTSHREVLQLVVGCTGLQLNEQLQSGGKATKRKDKAQSTSSSDTHPRDGKAVGDVYKKARG